MTDNLPLGTLEDAKAPRQTRTVTWAWAGKRYTAELHPLIWEVEKESLRACASANGIDAGKFIDFLTNRLVKESSIPIRDPKERAQFQPGLMWAFAKQAGFLGHLRDLGVRLVNDESETGYLKRVLREHLTVEHRLRRAGYTIGELDELPAEDVRRLYAVEEEDRVKEIEEHADRFALIVAARLGVG